MRVLFSAMLSVAAFITVLLGSILLFAITSPRTGDVSGEGIVIGLLSLLIGFVLFPIAFALTRRTPRVHTNRSQVIRIFFGSLGVWWVVLFLATAALSAASLDLAGARFITANAIPTAVVWTVYWISMSRIWLQPIPRASDGEMTEGADR